MPEVNFIVIILSLEVLLTLFFLIKYSIEATFSYIWSKVEGIIESSYCKRHTGFTLFSISISEGPTYRPDITYLYNVDGKEYRSERVKIGYQKVALLGIGLKKQLLNIQRVQILMFSLTQNPQKRLFSK